MIALIRLFVHEYPQTYLHGNKLYFFDLKRYFVNLF